MFATTKRLIIKIGSRLLLDEAEMDLDVSWLKSLVQDIEVLHRRGVKVVLVTSGAVASGAFVLNLKRAQLTVEQKQAAAAVGQIRLMHAYQQLLAERQLQSAQILLTSYDLESRRPYINLRNTMECLLRMGVIPILNENDSVTAAELRYGDNDRLAARVAQMVEADTLILLSDIDGLYSENPHQNKAACFIHEVDRMTPEIEAMAGDSVTDYGSGGMITKMMAAKIATGSGCRVLITKGKVERPLQHFEATQRGTWFLAQTSLLSAKKRWLKEHLQPLGYITIDAGAVAALRKGKSLLPVGVTQGRFVRGDAVVVLDLERHEIARGLVNYSESELHKIQGCATGAMGELLGYAGCHEVIHRNNLVLTEKTE